MNFLRQLMAKFQQFMVGRYGSDEFTLFLSIAGTILYCLGSLLRWFRSIHIIGMIVCTIGVLMLYYSVFRTFSKKYEKRRNELNWYLRWSQKPKAEIKILMNQVRDRKTHRYYKCKNCKTVMRVPKGRGKIEITCPKCRMKTIKKT